LVGILTYGCEIGAESVPTIRSCRNHNSSQDNADLISKKIASDLAKGHIRIATEPIIVSPLGLVPKSDGGYRRIHDLSFPPASSVNDAIPEEYGALVYTTVTAIQAHVISAGRGCLLLKRDIKDAFRMVPLSYRARTLMGFSWEGVTYQECCLSFGLRTAPLIFNLFAEGLHWILYSQLPCEVEHYLDDFIFILANPNDLAAITQTYISVTDSLGIPRNDSKDTAGTVIEVLGYTIDTIQMQTRLSPQKQSRAIEEVTTALQHGSLSFLQAQQLAGYLAWCAHVIRLSRSYSRSLWIFITTWPETLANKHKPRRFSTELRSDLCVWLDLLTTSNGVLFFDDVKRAHIHLFTDASTRFGYGGFYFFEELEHEDNWQWYTANLPQSQAFSTLPKPSQQVDHINPKEMHAIAHAFNLWSTNWQHSALSIHTDSMVVHHGIEKTVVRGVANESLRKILLAAIAHDITLSAKWIPGDSNGLADALSRFQAAAIHQFCPHWALDLLLPKLTSF
jgi:ribonuclease HI